MNRSQWVRLGAALVSGVLFGVGLLVSGMTEPRKVLGFLDLFGRWDPSLLLVMLGAISVLFTTMRWSRSVSKAASGAAFSVPPSQRVTSKLIVGAAIFGVGWGLGGYCPGPSVVSLASGSLSVFVLFGATLFGLWGTGKFEAARAAAARAADSRASEVPCSAESAWNLSRK